MSSEFWAEYLLGPLGGLCALFFGLGAGAGWHFNHRTIGKANREKIADLEKRIEDIETKNKEYDEFLKRLANMNSHTQRIG